MWPVYSVAIGSDQLICVAAVEGVDIYGVEDCTAGFSPLLEGRGFGIGGRKDFVVGFFAGAVDSVTGGDGFYGLRDWWVGWGYEAGEVQG